MMTTLQKTDSEMLEAEETYKLVSDSTVTRREEDKSQPLPEEIKVDERLEISQEVSQLHDEENKEAKKLVE